MMGRSRVQHFSQDPRSRVVVACGRDEGKLRETVSDDAVRLITDPVDVYSASDVDAVVISICNVLHYQHIKAALEAGKHVHCEYPLTDDLATYDELVALAREHGLVLHHGLTVRAESLHLAMKGALAQLGEPRCAYYRYYGGGGWYLDPYLRGDAFCAFHIHFIDQFIDFFGQPNAILAHGVERDNKMSAVATMRWNNGIVGTIEFAMGFTDKPGYMGTIVTEDGWCGFSNDPERRVTIARGGEVSTAPVPADTSQTEDAQSFLDEILGTGPPQRDLAAGRNAIALSLECGRQLAS